MKLYAYKVENSGSQDLSVDLKQPTPIRTEERNKKDKYNLN